MEPSTSTRAAHLTAPGHPVTDGLLAGAVRDNADWCALFARTHGMDGVTDADAWTSPTRTPPGYPDAVTLRPGVDAAAILSRLDTATGECSVKDSYSDLDLSPSGFRELFRATWIGRLGPPGPGGLAFQRVTDAQALRAWEVGWGHHSPEPRFQPALLAAPQVEILAARDESDVVAGAIVTRFGDDVVGVSNVFTSTGDIARTWAGIQAWTAEHHPGAPLVGYERGDELTAALDAGFRELGELRVWMAAD